MISPCSRYAPFATGAEGTDEVAGWIAEFDGYAARRFMDFAQYDFHLEPQTAAIVAGAITTAVGRGVEVRFLQRRPPQPDPGAAAARARRGADRLNFVPRERSCRRAGPDAPQVRRPRRRDCLDGLMNPTDDRSRQENVDNRNLARAGDASTCELGELVERGAQRSGFVDTPAAGPSQASGCERGSRRPRREPSYRIAK